MAELKWEPAVDAAHIGVTSKDGVVTLSGHVASFAEKWHAERAAQRVSGVQALAVEIDVTLAGSSKRNDEDIARTAENVLQWTTDSRHAVKVKVEHGWITLTGTLDWDYQRQAAVNAVCNLMGVVGVRDEITIKQRASASIVKADIEAALRRRSQSDAQKISVTVQDGNVTLSGLVNSWSERTLAKNSAWGAPGVTSVIDKMSVTY
jgi:osmotically-inducible protein OsmY